MGGLDVIALRGICASYFETHVAPTLREVREAQSELDRQFQELRTGGTSARAADEARVQDMERRLSAIEEVIIKMVGGGGSTGGAPSEPLQAGGGLDVSALQALVESKEAAQAAQASQIDDLRQLLKRKADCDRVCTKGQLAELAAEFRGACDKRDYVDQAQLKKLSEAVSRKANANKVPTIAQLEELELKVENNCRMTPTSVQLDGLAVQLRKELKEACRQKADGSVVQQLRQASAELEAKVMAINRAYDETSENSFDKRLEAKADAADVATQVQLKEYRTIVEKKLAFFASKIEEKTNNNNTGDMQYQPYTWCLAPTANGETAWQCVQLSTPGQSPGAQQNGVLPKGGGSRNRQRSRSQKDSQRPNNNGTGNNTGNVTGGNGNGNVAMPIPAQDQFMTMQPIWGWPVASDVGFAPGIFFTESASEDTPNTQCSSGAGWGANAEATEAQSQSSSTNTPES